MNAILYPTDFSDCAGNALATALDLAKRKQMQLAMLHVQDVILLGNEPELSITQKARATEKELREAALSKMQVQLQAAGAGDVAHQCIVRAGEPANELAHMASEINIDFIVMGSRGENAHRGFLMGSVTQRTIRNSTHPVLVLPACASYKPFRHIAYATDLSKETKRSIQQVVEFAKLYDAAVTLVHVNSPDDDHAPPAVQLSALVAECQHEKLGWNLLHGDDLLTTLDTYIHSASVDLLAMTYHHSSLFDRLFHKSQTTAMALHTDIPFLALVQ